ncbi:hypothetical protein ACL90Y_02480 [Micrococcus luteus]
MKIPIHREGDRCDQDLVLLAGKEWRKFPSLISEEISRGASKYLGRSPARELAKNEYSDTHAQFALLLSLVGESTALVPLFRGDLLMEEAVKPYRSITLEIRRAVNKWCAARVGLTGWAELFSVPAGPEPGPEDRIPRVSFFQDPEPSWADMEFDDAGMVDGATPPTGSDFVAFLRMDLDRLTWLIVAESIPWMNDCGWSPEWMAREIDWLARNIRAQLGLPQDQPVPVPDPRVDLPPEFTGFVTG